MLVLPNPAKDAVNRAKHGWDFGRIGEIFAGPVLLQPDDRPLGYDREGRIRVTGLIGGRVVRLVYEPVDLGDGELVVEPISLRDATRREKLQYWELYK